MDEYVNKAKATRMGGGDKAPKGNEVSVAPQSKSSEVVSSNEGGKVSYPVFEDAGNFLRGGGKVDGEMESIGNVNSIPKGSSAPGKPNVEKGESGPQGPGVL